MSLYVGGTPVKDIAFGVKGAKQVYLGSKLIWQARTDPEVMDFTSVGSFSVSVPDWASTLSYTIAGGGSGGAAGNGGTGAAGMGGVSGDITYRLNYSVTPGATVSGLVGAGGQGGQKSKDPGSAGTGSQLFSGSLSLAEVAGGDGQSTAQTGRGKGWHELDTNTWTRLQLANSPFLTGSPNPTSFYTGPASATTNGGSGSYGVGGNGGNGGIFGSFTKGGKGGNGFVRLVFWP